MKLRIWGTRGSQASPGPDTMRYGGNTSCVQVDAEPGSVIVLDAGTGIRRLSGAIPADVERIDILLSHLHMDHIQGLGFFEPLHQPGREIHLWGPASTTMGLRARLSRYLSPPLFPVRLRDLASALTLHEVPFGCFELPGVTAAADLVCHPGATVGYRLERDGRVVTFLPDHDPRLGSHDFPAEPEWTSGYELAHRADVLVHDAQYTPEEYAQRQGWGHCALVDAVRFAHLCQARRLVLFHHDPAHDDDTLDRLIAAAKADAPAGLEVVAAREGVILEV